MTNKEKAITFINSFTTGNTEILQNILTEDFIQHNLTYGTGKKAFIGLLEHLEKTTVENIRAYEDGDFVFLHSVYNFSKIGKYVAFDIFRFENGKIVEHWDNLIALTEPNISGHTQIDGTVEIKDIDKTKDNKALITKFAADILKDGKMSEVTSYFDGDNCIEHNPNHGDGLSGLGAYFEELAKSGIQMIYNKTHMVLGEGDFVLAVSEGTFDGVPTSFYDLFRIENNKIAEHWDVVETIIPETERRNSNGKF